MDELQIIEPCEIHAQYERKGEYVEVWIMARTNFGIFHYRDARLSMRAAHFAAIDLIAVFALSAERQANERTVMAVEDVHTWGVFVDCICREEYAKYVSSFGGSGAAMQLASQLPKERK